MFWIYLTFLNTIRVFSSNIMRWVRSVKNAVQLCSQFSCDSQQFIQSIHLSIFCCTPHVADDTDVRLEVLFSITFFCLLFSSLSCSLSILLFVCLFLLFCLTYFGRMRYPRNSCFTHTSTVAYTRTEPVIVIQAHKDKYLWYAKRY